MPRKPVKPKKSKRAKVNPQAKPSKSTPRPARKTKTTAVQPAGLSPSPFPSQAAYDSLINSAVLFINDHTNRMADSPLEIGRYLLKTFFSDDPSIPLNHSPSKSLSLHDLADHPDISLSYQSLQRFTRLAAHEKKYFEGEGPGTGGTSGLSSGSTLIQLSASVKLLLLRLEEKNPELIRVYAERAVSENLSFRRLQDILREDGHISTRGLGAIEEDKRRLIGFGLSGISSSLDGLLSDDVNLEKFDMRFSPDAPDLPKDAVKKTIEKVRAAQAKLGEIVEKLEKRL